jgi:peptidoglycan/xylan/chitin deacetylase (PgdA/CDA1 family)
MWRLRYAVKATLAYTLYYLGVLDLMRSRVLRNKAVVLMYHRVLPEAQRARTASHPGYVVSDTTFARHMHCLSQRFTVLSEQQFVSHLDDGHPFPDSSCLITFDDGWHDNLTHALPVLRTHHLPAAIYLPVNFIGTRRLFWREALTHALLEAIRQQRRGDVSSDAVRNVLESHGLGHVLDIADPDPRSAVIEAVQQQAHRRMQDDGAVVKALETLLGVEVQAMETGDTFLSWDEVHDMAAAGISFGAHGVEHRLLGELPPAEADFEVRESKRVVTERVGAPVVGLTYPNGSVTPAVRGMVEAAGYRVAFTTEPGPVAVGDDRFLLRRINVHEDMTASTPMFLARIVGLF